MIKTELVLVFGGARSGKSVFAEQLAEKAVQAASGDGPGTVLYVATARIMDTEMEERVKIYKARRPSHWKTLEPPILIEDFASDTRCFSATIIDCLTILAADWFLESLKENACTLPSDRALESGEMAKVREAIDTTLKKVARLAEVLMKKKGQMIVVANEVGQGLVPEAAISRFYRDLMGLANQVFARHADEVYYTVVGIPVRVKPPLGEMPNRFGC